MLDSTSSEDAARLMLLTMDVEALPRRARRAHVQKLIYGKFENGRLGIREMLDAAERLNFRFTCFFDYCEYDRYGEILLDVAREIAKRGHDLELHAHPEMMSGETWQKLGVSRPGKLDEFSFEHADALGKYLLDMQARVSTKAPVAFRGGGYAHNENLISAMKKYGLLLSSNHNPGRRGREIGLGSRAFRYENGVIEIPISVLSKDGKRIEFNFNGYGFTESLDWFPQEFDAAYGPAGVLNLVTHSKSLLVREPGETYFTLKGREPFKRYKALLDRFSALKFRVLGADELAREWRDRPLSVSAVSKVTADPVAA